MTNVYSAQTTAYASQSDNLFVEISAPASTTLKIKKIRIMHNDGTDTVTSDYYRRAKLIMESVAGTGGNSYTPIALDANEPASTSTVKTGSFVPGTISSTIDVLSLHNGTDFYWSAVDEDDKIVVSPGGIFGITLNWGT